MTGTGNEPLTRDRACWTAAWALRHCQGFRVDCPLGRLGYVEEVKLDASGDPTTLVVGGERRSAVPIAQVVAIDVELERVRLR
jgi:hypothetical protein